MNDTKRAERELRQLQQQMIVKRADNGFLLPHERSLRAVWAGWRWRELLCALGAAGWLGVVWLWWMGVGR